MAQQQSPWLEGVYGWALGEGGWNTGMDQNLLKFSFMFDRNVDSVVASLPAAVNGQAHYLTTDNRLYFAVGTTYFSTPTPKWFEFKVRTTGDTYQFNGTSAVQIDSPTQLDSRLDAIELTVASLGTAAFKNTEFFATQAALDVAAATAAGYTDTLRTDLSNNSDPDGSSFVGYRGRTVRGRLDDEVFVTDYGAKGDGVTDDYAAIMAAAEFARLSGRKTLVFPNPEVSYAVGAMLELALVDNFSIIGEGFPTIKYIGSEAVPAVVSLNYNISGGRYGIRLENFNIQGSANVTDALYMEEISHSTIRNIRAWDAVHSCIHINSGVCNLYENLRATSVGGIAGAPGVAPIEGIVLNQTVPGNYVAWCTFVNTIAENVQANGIRLNSATGCMFIGGTSEGNGRGVFINTGCNYNLFQNIDYEVNGVNGDMVINGSGNVIVNNQSLSFESSNNYDVQDAQGTVFKGGNLRSVNLQSASRDTKFFGCRFSDHPALGITGSGGYTSYGCVKEDNSGLVSSTMPDYIGRIGLGTDKGGVSVAVGIRGYGSTSATSALTVKTVGGDTVLQCRDDGVLFSPAAYGFATASPSNMFVGSDGSIGRSTSALKYKDVQGPIPREMVDALLGRSGFLYRQKGDADSRLYVGMAADDFDVDGLRSLVSYGENGEVEGLHYERLTVLLLEEIKSLRERVNALEKA